MEISEKFSGVTGLSEEESTSEYDLRQQLDGLAKEALFGLLISFTGTLFLYIYM